MGAVVTPVGRRGLPTRFGSSAGGKAGRAQAHLVGCGLDDASDRRDAGQGQWVLLTPGFAQHPQRLFAEVGVAPAQALRIAHTSLGRQVGLRRRLRGSANMPDWRDKTRLFGGQQTDWHGSPSWREEYHRIPDTDADLFIEGRCSIDNFLADVYIL